MHIDDTQFSEREKDVVRLLLQAKGNKQIALELGISKRTVEFHLSNIYAKLGVNSRAEATLKLTGSHLWETTGNVQVEATVTGTGDPTENDLHIILRRILMKKTYYLVGGLLAAALLVILVLINVPTPGLELIPSPSEPMPTASLDNATATLPVATEIDQPVQVIIPPHTVNGYTAAISRLTSTQPMSSSRYVSQEGR